MAPASAIARLSFRSARVQTGSFALFFALVALVNVEGYRHSYPTPASRLAFVHSFADNKAVRLFYGVPHDLTSVGGYAAWRIGGFMCIFAGLWGALAAVRALRTEEDSGRQELVLAAPVSRSDAFLARAAAVALSAAVLWLGTFLGLVAGRLPAVGSAFLALATVSPAFVFAGVGALASQLAPTRRVALELSSGALGIALLIRVVADTSSTLGWMRWLSPLGWAEELRAFADTRPLVLLLPALATVALFALAGRIATRRDVGVGLLAVSDTATADLRLLGSPTAQTLRSERGSLIGWLVGIGFFAFVIGSLSGAISSTNVPANLQRQLQKVGGASITSPAGALGLYFLFFILAIALFGCSQIAAARREEADEELETLLALPVGRLNWFGGRLLLASAAMAMLALAAAVFAWAGAAASGAGVSLPRLVGAGANCLPASLLFLGIGALAFGLLPRASAGIAYGLVSLAFVWELFGALLGAPGWTLGLSPFHHVGLVPSQPFRAAAAAIMLAIGAAAALLGGAAFRRRDLAAG
ncbi:MAG TPA: ABC transporter permease subunit [Thermoleophilaceae bacterium]|jgi:ABC-2 type transport system permease protein